MEEDATQYMLQGWGANQYGQLGLGFTSEECAPPQLCPQPPPLSSHLQISGGGGHTILWTVNGNMWASGFNQKGQLGLGDKLDRTRFSPLPPLPFGRINQVACGFESTLIVSEEGELFSTGSRFDGDDASLIFTKLPLPEKIKFVSCGLKHVAAVTESGGVLTWGSNNRGQCGAPSNVRMVSTPTLVKDLGNIRTVACGHFHTLALTSSGEVVGWGDNRRKQLTDGAEGGCAPTKLPIQHRVEEIASGWTHALVLTAGKEVLSWGRNNLNQLGRPCGSEEDTGKPGYVKGMPPVTRIYCGYEHSVAVANDGSVWSWGWNEHSNCGVISSEQETIAGPFPLPLQKPMAQIGIGAAHGLVIHQR